MKISTISWLKDISHAWFALHNRGGKVTLDRPTESSSPSFGMVGWLVLCFFIKVESINQIASDPPVKRC